MPAKSAKPGQRAKPVKPVAALVAKPTAKAAKPAAKVANSTKALKSSPASARNTSAAKTSQSLTDRAYSELEELISYCDVLAESKANEANAARNGNSSRLSD